MRRLHAVLVLLLAVGWVARQDVAGAFCGDGVLEAEYELCDDGVANGTNACCTTNCDFIDSDSDGICDAEDPCVGSSPILHDVALVVKGFATGPADDSFRLTATLTPSEPLDPARTGFAFALGNRFFGAFAHAAIPAGPAWRPGARAGWSFRDPTGTAGGVTRVKLKRRNDGVFTLAIDGRRGDYAALVDIRPVRVAVALAAPTADVAACGEAFLSVTRCPFGSAGNTMRCDVPPQPRRCGDDPDARVRCDALNAAAAEEAYFAVHGSYASGDCTTIPGFVASSGTILCVATGSDTDFALSTAGLDATVTCTYDTNPPPNEPNLVCH